MIEHGEKPIGYNWRTKNRLVDHNRRHPHTDSSANSFEIKSVSNSNRRCSWIYSAVNWQSLNRIQDASLEDLTVLEGNVASSLFAGSTAGCSTEAAESGFVDSLRLVKSLSVLQVFSSLHTKTITLKLIEVKTWSKPCNVYGFMVREARLKV